MSHVHVEVVKSISFAVEEINNYKVPSALIIVDGTFLYDKSIIFAIIFK